MISREMYNLTRLLKNETQTDVIIDSYRKFFLGITREMVINHDAKFKNYILFLKRSQNIMKERQEIELQVYANVIGEYVLILQTYMRENISLITLDRMSKNNSSFPIMESLKESPMSYNELKDSVVIDKENSQDNLDFQRSFNSLFSLRLIEKIDDKYQISQKGSNLYISYETNKKLTNKYERVRRNQLNAKSIKVDVELLKALSKVPNTFKVLKTMKESTDVVMVEDNIREYTGVLEVQPVLDTLVGLTLVKRRNDNVYVLTSTGANVFRKYRKSKKYTNKYESLKRNT